MPRDQALEENAYTVGVQAYLWGFPLQFYAAANVGALKAGGIDINNFRKFSALKTAKDRFVVTPNNVTVDAYCLLDLTREPVVVHVPALADARWYIVQIGDLFDEVAFNVGGVKGPRAGDYVVVGPDFQGPTPTEMTRIPLRTRHGICAARIFANGQADVAAAVEAQKGFRVLPLGAYLRDGLTYVNQRAELPPASPCTAPDALRPFEAIGRAMKHYLPIDADLSDPLVATFRQIGLSVARGFDWKPLSEPVTRGLARAAAAAEEMIDRRWESLGETTNGWRYNMAGGRSGHDLVLRAALAKYVVGAQLATEVLYPNTRVDAANEPLSGQRKYTLTFPKGQLPPVAVFWNLAMYADDMLFVENDFGRYSIGSTTDGLKQDTDGSLTILIQHDAPDDKANWLPAPAGPFNLTFRFYGPMTAVLDGSYRLPGLRSASAV